MPSHGLSSGSPYTTVRQAISDLPRIANGASDDWLDYTEPSPDTMERNHFLRQMRHGAPRGIITDHIASRHSQYVLDRYRLLRVGQNWKDIVQALTNYTAVERTHSNIYRRLRESGPSITIGHYRKSMIVHPRQCRGLSVREAARLQSFPDWFRFAGTADGRPGGILHKQQQLANAVCPLLSKAIAERLLPLAL
jgi:site-specific DNA-cytosine methylase